MCAWCPALLRVTKHHHRHRSLHPTVVAMYSAYTEPQQPHYAHTVYPYRPHSSETDWPTGCAVYGGCGAFVNYIYLHSLPRYGGDTTLWACGACYTASLPTAHLWYYIHMSRRHHITHPMVCPITWGDPNEPLGCRGTIAVAGG